MEWRLKSVRLMPQWQWLRMTRLPRCFPDSPLEPGIHLISVLGEEKKIQTSREML